MITGARWGPCLLGLRGFKSGERLATEVRAENREKRDFIKMSVGAGVAVSTSYAASYDVFSPLKPQKGKTRQTPSFVRHTGIAAPFLRRDVEGEIIAPMSPENTRTRELRLSGKGPG